MKSLRAELTKAENKVEDIKMRGTGSSPPIFKTMTDAATNTEKMMYSQAAMQTQAKGKGKGSKLPAGTLDVSGGLEVSAHLPQQFPFVEDLSEYEEEGGEGMKNGMMAKEVAIHGVEDKWGSRLCRKDNGGGYWS